MSTTDRPFTPQELEQLATLYPARTSRSPAGNIVADMTRAEFLALAARFPTMHFPPARPAPTGNAEADAMRARYPNTKW